MKTKYCGNIMMRVAAVLFCLVLISTHFMSGLYARYISRGEGEDDARVAKFEVSSEWAGTVNIDVTKTTEGNFTFKVNNLSEVAISYDLVLTFENDFPTYLSAEIGTKTGTVDVDGKTVTFEKLESLPSATEGATNTLLFTVTNVDGFTKNAVGNTHSEVLNFTAIIDCVQID